MQEMREINIIDYVKEVESNRQLLIQHCKDNGKEISDSAALRTAVNINNTINLPNTIIEENVEQCTITWYDLDGTILHSETVEKNSPLPQYNGIPNYDSDYLDFEEWVYTSGIETIDGVQIVTHDVEVAPMYRNKDIMLVQDTEVHPTIMRITVTDPDALTITFPIKSHTSAATYFSIDWGDGSEYTLHTTHSASSSTTLTHTYPSVGQYVIRVATVGGANYISVNTGCPTNPSSVYLNDFYVGTGAYLYFFSGPAPIFQRTKYTINFSKDMHNLYLYDGKLNVHVFVWYPSFPIIAESP